MLRIGLIKKVECRSYNGDIIIQFSIYVKSCIHGDMRNSASTCTCNSSNTRQNMLSNSVVHKRISRTNQFALCILHSFRIQTQVIFYRIIVVEVRNVCCKYLSVNYISSLLFFLIPN